MKPQRHTIDIPHCARSRSVDALLIGGGRAGINILQLFELYGWFRLRGLVDVNQEAPGIKMAHSLGVPTHDDVSSALLMFKGDLVIDATGDEEVSVMVSKYCAVAGLDYITGKSAKLLFHLSETHVKERHEIQEKTLRLELLRTMLQLYQQLGDQNGSKKLVNTGLEGTAKLIVSRKAMAIEHIGSNKFRVLGTMGLNTSPIYLEQAHADRILCRLPPDSQSLVYLEDPISLPEIEAEFNLAAPLFIDGRMQYLMLFQVPSMKVNTRKKSFTTLMTHLQKALQADSQHKVLRELAYRDPLTGVYNRRFFDERIKEEVNRFNRSKRNDLAVMFIDMDNFKTVNDELGHAHGDQLLTMVTQMIYAKLRSYDILARYGGDEFVILLQRVDQKQVETVAQRIINATSSLRLPQPGISPESLGFSLSIGIAIAKPKSKVKTSKLIKLADQALYEAKSSGRNRYCLDIYDHPKEVSA